MFLLAGFDKMPYNTSYGERYIHLPFPITMQTVRRMGLEDNQRNRMAEQDDEYEKVCYMCRRPESKAGKMITMPGGIDICRDCMQRASDMIVQSGLDLSKFPTANPNQLWNKGAAPGAKKDARPAGQQEKPADHPEAAEPTESGTPENGPASPGVFPWGNMGFGIPLGQIDLTAITGKKRVKKKSTGGKKKELFKLNEIPAPHTIKERLDEYVIGQEQAKKAISVAVYNHYKRVFERTSPDAEKYGTDVEIEKSNILMIGPTGSGKTYLVKTLAKLLNVPLAIADATSLTEAGYIGDDIESVLSKLLAAADNDVERAETGIVFIDEIDKIAKKRSTSTRDVSGESVQQELLKLLEGTEAEVPVGTNQKNAMTPMETVNTDHILFICGGAFPELETIIKERLNEQSSIGFNADIKNRFDKDPELLRKVTNQDLRKFGMIPEFLGRLPVTVTLSGLTKEFLIRILKEPKNAILKQYQKLLEMDEVRLRFDEDALDWIAGEAMKRETGARALRAIIEEFMLDIMYEIPKDANIGAVTITRAYLEKKGGPRIEMRGAMLPEPVSGCEA